MKASRILSFLNRFWIQEAASYLAAFFVFVLILLNRSPNVLRPLSMNIRFGFTWIIPLVFIVLYYSFRMSGWPGKLLSLTATLSLFSLALAGVWASGHTQSTYISGLIPLYDAQTYYVDALRLLAGKSMLEFSAARPLFASFLATVLTVTGRDLMVSLMVLTALNGLASFYAARAIQSTHGIFAAAFLVIFLFLYYRYRTVGTVMSENIGFALGILGVGLIWWSIKNNSFPLALFGLFINTIALNARPGPFFILPALLLWGSWYYKNPDERFSWRFFLQGIAVIGTGFASNLLIKHFFGVPSGVPFSQFSYVLYGLASGGNSWSHIFQAHPELSDMAQPELTWTAYRLTFDLVKQHPILLVQGVFHNWSVLFSTSWYNLFSYVGGENSSVRLITLWFLYLLCFLGVIKWLQQRSEPYMSFIIAGVAGILASAPFVPATDAYGMRLYAASIIMLGLLPAMGLDFALDKLKINTVPVVDSTNSQPVIWYSSLLILIILIGPFLVRGTSHLSKTPITSCKQDMDSVVARIDGGTSIHLIREKEPGLDWIPTFHYGIFKRNVHSLPNSHFISELESVEPHSSFFYTLDYRSNQAALVIIPTAMLPPIGSTVEICGQWEDDPALKAYYIFRSKSVIVLPDLE